MTTSRVDKCSYCGKGGELYFKRDSGEIFCPTCLKKSVTRRIKKTISKYTMLEPHDTLLVLCDPFHEDILMIQLEILLEIERSYKTKIIVGIHEPQLAESVLELSRKVLGMERVSVLSVEYPRNYTSLSEEERLTIIENIAENVCRELEAHCKTLVLETLDEVAARIVRGLLDSSPNLIFHCQPVVSLNCTKLVRPFFRIRREELEFLSGVGGSLGREAEWYGEVCKLLDALETDYPSIKYSTIAILPTLLRVLDP